MLLALIAGLETFLRLSHKHTAFSNPSSTVRNVLTYIPVLVLIFIGWFWKIYDLEVKKLAPWGDIRKRPTFAKDLLLFDYTGTNYVAAAFTAIRRRHWSVIAVVVGSLLIAVATILATSLWIIEPSSLQPEIVTLTRTSTFEGGSFRNDTRNTYLIQYIGGLSFNLPPPDWTIEDHGFTPFYGADEHIGNGRIQATTTAFSSELNCEPLGIVFKGTTNISAFSESIPIYQMKLGWRGCEREADLTHPSLLLCDGLTKGSPKFASQSGYWGDNYLMECFGTTTNAMITVRFNETVPDRSTGIGCTASILKSDVSLTVNASTSTLLGDPVFSKLPQYFFTIRGYVALLA